MDILMDLNFMIIILTIIFTAIYVLRYQNNLRKRLALLAIGSFVIYLILTILLPVKFSLIYVFKSMLLYVLIDQILFYYKVYENKESH